MSRFTFYYIKYVFIPCVLLLSITLFVSFTSHGASASGPKLPILVENIDIVPYQSYINNTYGGFWNLSADNVIGWGSQENGYYVQTFAMVQNSDQIVSYLTFSPVSLDYSYPDFDYSSNTLTLTFSNLANDNYNPWRLVTFYTNGNNGPGYPYAAAFNTANTINKGVYGNTGSTLNYISSDIYLTSNGSWVANKPIFVTELPPVVPDFTGHAVPPDFDGLDPVFNTGHSKPSSVPQFRGWSNYTWSNYTPPTFDDSSVVNAIESVGDIIEYTGEYLVNNIGGAINNLGSNIKGFFEDLGNIFIYYGSLIIDNIQNAVTNIYDNFVVLLEPITSFFNNLIAMGTDENDDFSIGTLLGNIFVYLFIPSAEDINDVLVENDQYGIITLSTQMTQLSNNFIHHLATDTAIYVIEIPQFTIYHQTLGPYYVNFQWYYDNYKSIGDSIISAFLVFGFFMWLYSRFPYWLRGQQGDITKAVTEVKK